MGSEGLRAGWGDAIVARALFWIPVAVTAWVYAGYPLTAAAVARLRPIRLRPTGLAPRSVTVAIAAHNAASELADRVLNALDQQVDAELDVIVASDGSSDGTDSAAAALADSNPRVTALSLPRTGQTTAQAEMLRRTRAEVVVLTDAETRFEPDCVERLIAPFADPRVGCVTGHLRWRFDRDTPTSRDEGQYWRYEQAVRRAESGAGWLAAASGPLMAVRRDCYRPAPPDASLDQLLPLFVREQGLAVIVAPDAIATDRGPSSLGDQYQNRMRIATQGIRANLMMARRILPWRAPGPALALWSHKVLRWATPWLLGASLWGAILLVRQGRVAYALPIAATVGVAGVAGAAALSPTRVGSTRIGGLALSFVVVNAAFLVGWLNVLRGRRIASWAPIASRRGDG